MADLNKFHSAIRWGKEISELEGFTAAAPELVNEPDPQNGNQAIHLSTQNGHIDITKWLVNSGGANVNAQNGKGQTALHMSVAYDFYFQTVFLLGAGADKTLKNSDGNEAIKGIDGDHEVWDNPIFIFKAIRSKEDMEVAFTALENAEPGTVDKGELVGTGMRKKKEFAAFWDQPRFMEICKKH